METENNIKTAQDAVQESEIPEINFDEFTIPTYDEWKNEVITALKGGNFDKQMFTKTYEGITLHPIYRMEDTDNLTQCKTYPGQQSDVRGVHAAGYLSKLWTIAQETDGKTPQEANVIQKRELLKGSTAISFCLDTATREGLDADKASKNIVADCGVSLSTLEDLETILTGVKFDETELALYAGASNTALLGNIAALAEKKGFSTSKLHGAVAADPIGEYITDGKLPRPLDEYYDEMAHAIKWADKNAPNLRTVLIDADVYHNGGANAIQEAAYAMSEAVDYIKAMQIRGISVDAFAKHVRFHFSIGANFFMEIAKLRGVKMLWAQVMEAFEASEESKKINLFVSTSSFTQTVFDPYVNVLRAATQSFSAVIGGMDGMFVKPFDHVIRPSDEFSRRIARNIQIMMQSEFNFTQVVDPVGGSWYIEPLTEEFAHKAWEKFQEVEKDGGLAINLQNGKVQEAINTVLEERFNNLAKRKDRAVGNNMYPNMTEELLSAPDVDFEKILADRIAHLQANAAKREKQNAEFALKEVLESAGKDTGALIDAAKKAFLAGATMGEITTALNDGASSITVAPIKPHRWTERFEELRKRTEEFKKRTGENVTIFLANMGPIPQHKGRADFVTSFMQVAEFDVELNNGFPAVEEAVKAALASKRDVAIVCSTDATYPELAPAVCEGIKTRNPNMKVFLAGAPSAELKALCDAAGFDDYISVKSNCYETLMRMQKEKGMM
ncbi:MAG: methylmalonyl-CoA mutase family protein [Acidaminococcaceae bacterium]|nr:methylmalonyl-CoA mutase family protein [Acidaminococcaceae bacterium]